MGHDYVGPEHILLGVLREGESLAVQALNALGVDLAVLRRQVLLLASGTPAGDQHLQEIDLAGRGGPRQATARQPGPRCPSCRTKLDGNVAYRVLAVGAGPGPNVGELMVTFVYCQSCGVTIAHAPTGPDQPDPPTTVGRLVTRAGTPTARLATWPGDHRRPPAPTREFPSELWHAPPPTPVGQGELVDIRRAGRFSGDAKLQGTASGSKLELAVELPRAASSAAGTLDGRPVSVYWNLSNNPDDDTELTATLKGNVAGKRVDVTGVFRRASGYRFDGASVDGTLAGEHLTATIQAAAAERYASTGSVVANGTLATRPFEIYAALGGPLERGRVRGDFDGRPVHLNIKRAGHTDVTVTVTVTGTCPAPTAFTVLLVASVAFFA